MSIVDLNHKYGISVPYVSIESIGETNGQQQLSGK